MALRSVLQTRAAERPHLPSTGSSWIRARRALWRGLGILWLVDALLQMQPGMFTSAFVGGILVPSAAGQPAWIAIPLQFADAMWTQFMVPANLVAIVVQFAIALLLLLAPEHKWGRIGLLLSIVWGTGVWIVGEGLGMLFTGSATFITGAPGSVALYVLAAIFLLIPGWLWERGEVLGWLEAVLGFLFIGGAVLQAVPYAGFWTSDGLSDIFAGAASSPQPSFLSGPIYALAASTAASPAAWNLLFVAVMAVLGIALIYGWFPIVTYSVAIVWSFFGWWFGQAFGQPFTGISTDPNSGVIWIVLFACLLIWRMPLPQESRQELPTWREAVASASAIRWRKSSFVPGPAMNESSVLAVDSGRVASAGRHSRMNGARPRVQTRRPGDDCLRIGEFGVA